MKTKFLTSFEKLISQSVSPHGHNWLGLTRMWKPGNLKIQVDEPGTFLSLDGSLLTNHCQGQILVLKNINAWASPQGFLNLESGIVYKLPK